MKNSQDFWAEWSNNKGKALVDPEEIKATELFQLAQDYAEYYHSEKLKSPECATPVVVKSDCPHAGDRFNPTPQVVICSDCMERLE